MAVRGLSSSLLGSFPLRGLSSGPLGDGRLYGSGLSRLSSGSLRRFPLGRLGVDDDRQGRRDRSHRLLVGHLDGVCLLGLGRLEPIDGPPQTATQARHQPSLETAATTAKRWLVYSCQ